uniref:Uncharacterized protein n=1 Tax=Sinocyclocheilus grahami TaxID=75366 RepID=A0A672L2U6_SINGR
LSILYKDPSGYTPLHLAAQSGHENMVRLLLNSPGVQADAETNIQARDQKHCCGLKRDGAEINHTDMVRRNLPLKSHMCLF